MSSAKISLRMTLDPLTCAPVRALVETHLRLMRASSPACSVHALEVMALRASPIRFWSAWSGDELVGCCALKPITEEHGELKSMHVLAARRGQGFAREILAYVEGVARDLGMTELSLETGSQEVFAPARSFYRRAGFRECGPFGAYRLDPSSCFLTKSLA